MSDPLSLQSLPLFPLQTVLYPEGYLPLQIFEVRYLDMVTRCHGAGAPFGVVALIQGSEVRGAPASPADASPPDRFHAMGTLARITRLTRPQPGLIWIQCSGGQRFVVQQHQQLKHGLWVADVTLVPPDAAVPIPSDLQPIARALDRVLLTLQAQGTPQESMPAHPPYRMDDCAWVANRWCELLPVGLELKQRLMALDNPLLRLELVGDLLERLDIPT